MSEEPLNKQFKLPGSSVFRAVEETKKGMATGNVLFMREAEYGQRYQDQTASLIIANGHIQPLREDPALERLKALLEERGLEVVMGAEAGRVTQHLRIRNVTLATAQSPLDSALPVLAGELEAQLKNKAWEGTVKTKFERADELQALLAEAAGRLGLGLYVRQPEVYCGKFAGSPDANTPEGQNVLLSQLSNAAAALEAIRKTSEQGGGQRSVAS